MNTLADLKVNEELFEKASDTLGKLGMDMSTAINVYLTFIVNRMGLPFDIREDGASYPVKKMRREDFSSPIIDTKDWKFNREECYEERLSRY